MASTLYSIFRHLTSTCRDPEPLGEPRLQPKKGRILLADDNSDMREYVCSLLERSWECVAVGDGLEALIMLQNNPGHFDVVLSDVMVSLSSTLLSPCAISNFGK